MLLQQEIRHVMLAAKYTWQGLCTTWREEMAFRIIVTVCLILFPFAFFIGNSAVEKSLLISSLILAIIVELINSSIENTADLACDQKIHPLAGNAKDQGSAATAIAWLNVIIVWLIIIIW
jgi:diacylglycerol kinase (ATP)